MIEPMLAETADKPFDSKEHIFELKLDGVRAIAIVNKQIEFWGRHNNNLTRLFPELQLIWASKPCILDGEIVGQDFNAVQHRVHKTRELDIKIASKRYPCVFEAFDILQVNGEDLTKRPLIERKEILGEVLDDNEVARFLGFVDTKGTWLFRQIEEQGLEGIMAKAKTSLYQIGKRSKDWLKIKAFKEDKFLICGLTAGENERSQTFGSLVLGKETENGLQYVGNVGSGFTEKMLKELSQIFEGLKGECPFKEPPDLGRELKYWLKPFLCCEVRYLESEGKLRFPTFRRFV